MCGGKIKNGKRECVGEKLVWWNIGGKIKNGEKGMCVGKIKN
jgi:hypothetical protein